MHAMIAPAHYFPVRDTPLTMRAGLRPFGEDFGNGASDRLYFQIDDEQERYLTTKRAVPAHRYVSHAKSPEHAQAHTTALFWVSDTLKREHGICLPLLTDDTASFAERWGAVHAHVQEDFALLHRGSEDLGEALCLYVAMPSGWRPERLLGATFTGIHEPVPGFAKLDTAARSMVRSMVERGPYVRFVWTLSADAELDHHPEEGHRIPWSAATEVFLRVERQVTIPLPTSGASLFLIRTYVTPVGKLRAPERATLHQALQSMPDDVAAYKGLLDARAHILALVREGELGTP